MAEPTWLRAQRCKCTLIHAGLQRFMCGIIGDSIHISIECRCHKNFISAKCKNTCWVFFSQSCLAVNITMLLVLINAELATRWRLYYYVQVGSFYWFSVNISIILFNVCFILKSKQLHF